MAELPKPTYDAKQYSGGRPTYPPELFQFISSHTPSHDLAWDVGTGTGQAIPFLAGIYKNVIGTDISSNQLEQAPKLPNVEYREAPAVMPLSEAERKVAPRSTVDLVTIAQAVHWFDLPRFYEVVRWALKKPGGVIAAWCYTTPQVNPEVDAVFKPFYEGFSGPGWKETTSAVDDGYRGIYFPFEPVEGVEGTGPFEFKAEKGMRLEDYFAYIRSWSAYNAAKERGVEMLGEEVVERFTRAWCKDGENEKVVTFPIYLRLGRVGNC